MILNHLTLLNYRSVAQAEISLSPKLNAFVGANGMGKTNVLDAIYHLSFCKSVLSPQDMYNVRHGADFFMIEGRYADADGLTMEVNCSMKVGGRKRFRVDGNVCRRFADHIGRLPLVLLSPFDEMLVTGAAEARRRFMDTVISQHDAAYLAALVRYDRSREQRNALLSAETPPDDGVMDVLEELLAADGARIVRGRRAFAERFAPLFARLYPALCPDDAEAAAVSVAYTPAVDDAALRDALRTGRAKERIVGHTLYGPHRDDMTLLYNGQPVRREASQGQTKTWTIVMKLAQYLYLRDCGSRLMPMLLLDDIFDKLDATRVARLVEYVSGDDFGQIFITDTNRSHLDHILEASRRDYHLFDVEQGRVQMAR